MDKDTRIGTIEILTAVMILSFSGPIVRWADLPSGGMTFVRTAIPSVVLGAWLLFRRRSSGTVSQLSSRQRGWLITASGINALRLWLFFEAYRLTSIGNAVIVLYSWPVFAMIYGAWLLREPLLRRDILLMGTAFIGVLVVYSGGEFSFANKDFLGMSLMLLSAALYGLMIILIHREGVERLQATFWQNFVGSVVYLPAFLIALKDGDAHSWAWAGLNGLAIGIFAFLLFFSSLRHLSAAVVGHYSYGEAIMALVWGVLLFGEPVVWRHILGGGLIVASMVFRAEITRRDIRGVRRTS